MNIIKKFREKLVVVEAIQWDGERDTLLQIYGWCDREMYLVVGSHDLIIRTLEGDMKVNIGDWIVKGVADEYYPVKDEFFNI